VPRFASETREEAVPVATKPEEPRISPTVVYAAAPPRVEEPGRPDLAIEDVFGPEVERMEIDEREQLEYAHVEEQPVMVAASRDQRVFSGTIDLAENQSNTEDLDVPAFMRRGGL